MGDKTGIEWTDASWNPIVGCSLVSPGCTNCYAMKQAGRLLDKPGSHYQGTTKKVNGNTVWTGKMAAAPQKILLQPMKWQRPRRVFVNSMSDLFHESVPNVWIDRVFAVMALCPQHTFQILTKRPLRMRDYLSQPGVALRWFLEVNKLGSPDWIWGLPRDLTALPNVWLGVSVEDQKRANERVPVLLDTPAALRFLSCEPLLGPIDLDGAGRYYLSGFESDNNGPIFHGLDWIIVGGESGPDARPMHPEWVRTLRDQCLQSRVPFFFKQWGEWMPVDGWKVSGKQDAVNALGGHSCHAEHFNVDGWHPIERVGKNRAGRTLDSCIWNEMPEVTA